MALFHGGAMRKYMIVDRVININLSICHILMGISSGRIGKYDRL